MADVADDLKRVPLFAGLGDRQRKRLARDFKERQFRAGMSVVRQGQMSGIGFFVIREGEARVTVDDQEIGRLGPGDSFGELGLISERTRTATVEAETPLRCLELTSWDFRRIVEDHPDVAWRLLQQLADLLADAEERAKSAAG